MPVQTKLRLFLVTAFALAFAPASFAQTSSCADSGMPVGGYVTIDCNLYSTSSITNFNLVPLMTEDGASLAANTVGASYQVLIDANPLTISDNDTNDNALFTAASEADWEAVLYFAPDNTNFPSQNLSDSLTVYYAGDFPSNLASEVQSLDEGVYGPGDDSAFFTEATSTETLVGGGNDNFYVYAPLIATQTPEPASFLLLFSGIAGIGTLAAFRRQRGVAASQA